MFVRHAHPTDCFYLFNMMRCLARHNNSTDSFHITQLELQNKLFQRKEHQVLVVEQDHSLEGYISFNIIPENESSAALAIISELYIGDCDTNRKEEITQALLSAISKEARKYRCMDIRWKVSSKGHK
ncbi:hypothetical protein [Microbulbifer sp. SSSA005]|uniref:hypothetical protein n=1 Tax=Microbulbifer sp. SSSA005 TaxID=3243378 RepID=UPI00403A345B